MTADTLAVTIIQPNMAWEDTAANLAHYSRLITGIEGQKEVVVLPEMFVTGFSMDAPRLAEGMDGETVAWMRETARRHRIILAGSVIIGEEGKYYNRLIWMQPDGRHFHYDKRHLFSLAGEEKVYTAGERRVIVSVKGFRICLQVCYDLRFPVWSRQSPTPALPRGEGGRMEQSADSKNANKEPDLAVTGSSPLGAGGRAGLFDILLYVANWPERRALPWKILLQARAIENQCYVVGVNRVGDDGAGIFHSGDSAVFSPLGEAVWQAGGGVEAVQTVTLERAVLDEAREKFPFWKDGDAFVLL